MTALFISDLHLSPERPEVIRAFFDFLGTTARDADELYILGDLYEAWIGDDDPSPLANDSKAAMRALSDSGTCLFIQHGNRDFLLGRKFARDCGATLLGDAEVIQHNDQSALLMHGDTLCIDDLAYMKFRRKARNPIYKWCLAHIPLKRRQKLAADWRARSMAANANKASAIMDVNAGEVDRQMQQYQVSLLIHGHTHRPARHPIDGGERIVLGDWHHSGWYLRWDDSGLELTEFAISKTDT